MTTGNASILIVEDDPSQSEVLRYNLHSEGYQVHTATSAEEGLLILEETDIDLAILDWMLPEMSGLEVCRQIKRKKRTAHVHVIMLTARGEENDKVRGLDTGADDFITKPYSIKELQARVRSGLRGQSGNKNVEVLAHKDLKIDLTRHIASISGKAIPLGRLEYKLLRVLIEAPGRVFSREQLLERVWGNDLKVETRTVDVHIGRLRKNLKSASNKDYIRTVRSFGYSLEIGS